MIQKYCAVGQIVVANKTLSVLISFSNLFSLGLFYERTAMTVKLKLNMFFKPQPGLGLQCPICANLLLSIACQGTQGSG